MGVENLLQKFSESESHFHRFLSELKEQISNKGLGNFPFCDMPIGSLTALNWIVSALEKLQYDTAELELKVTAMFAEVDQLDLELNGAYYQQLFNHLGQMVGFYEYYFNDFQKYKDALVSLPLGNPSINDYVMSRTEGIFFNDEDDFEFFFGKRTGIENLLDFLKDRFDVKQLQEKIEKLDIIARRDIWAAMKAFNIPENGLHTSDIAPEKYWWLHLKNP